MGGKRSNQEWLDDLMASDERQATAIEELHAALLKGAAFTCERHLGAQFSALEIELLAQDCAQDALLLVLQRLPEFRGESKFLTWAYKFAVNVSLTTARREQWKGMSLDDVGDFPSESQAAFRERKEALPEKAALREEIWAVLRECIQNDLTEKQKQVVKWMVFEDVPMDVVVQHLGTNRNAVYKLLHDARLKLKNSLQARGLDLGESLALFSPD